MAANDEIPRGLVLSASANPGQASVTFPAVSGIAWRLTAVQCTVVALATLSSGLFFLVNATDSGGDTLIGTQPCPLESGAPAGAQSQFLWSGAVQGKVGASVTVGFTNNNVQGAQYVVATAEPV